MYTAYSYLLHQTLRYQSCRLISQSGFYSWQISLLADETVAVVVALVVTDEKVSVEGEASRASLVSCLSERALDVAIAVGGVRVNSIGQTGLGAVVVVNGVDWVDWVGGGVEDVL